MSDPPVKVARRAEARIPTEWGEFQLFLYEDDRDHQEHLALVRGDIAGQDQVLVRVHSECFTGDVLGSRRCDCGEQLTLALGLIAEAGAGVLLYLRQEGRGIGLMKKLQAYNLPDQGGLDAVGANLTLGHQADGGDYDIAADILGDLGIRAIRLLTNNPRRIDSLEDLGIEITERIPLISRVTPDNCGCLRPKADRPHHLLNRDQSAYRFSGDQVLLSKLKEISTQALACCREHQRPLVTLTYAQSLDGSIAARPGHPLAISCSESQTFTHSLRAAHDAILVGIGTVLADNPRLNVRLVAGPNPQPVLLDSRLRFPSYANLLKDGNPPWVITTFAAEVSRQEDLEKRGAQVFRLPEGSCGGIDLEALLAKLGEMGINSIMVEGGAQVISSFITSRLVDQVIVTVAPVLVGGLRVLDSSLSLPLGHFPRLTQVSFHQVGKDLVLWGNPDWPGQ
jgi:3,4-dihydroxy 2-butanone 4-phosphate synthase/GTP cyclohydrolase II